MPSKWLIVAIGLAGCATGKQPAESSSASSATFCMPCTMPCVSPCEPAVATRFNPAPGSFAAPRSVTLSSPTPGAVIRYTTDGTKPTERSPAYAGAIPVERTTTITTIAQVPGLPPSKVASATYTIAPPPPVAVTPRRLQLNQRVLFRTGTATLDPRSAPVLDAVAGALQEQHDRRPRRRARKGRLQRQALQGPCGCGARVPDRQGRRARSSRGAGVRLEPTDRRQQHARRPRSQPARRLRRGRSVRGWRADGYGHRPIASPSSRAREG